MMDTEQRTRFGKLTIELFKRQSRKMAKHTQTILSVEADKLFECMRPFCGVSA